MTKVGGVGAERLLSDNMRYRFVETAAESVDVIERLAGPYCRTLASLVFCSLTEHSDRILVLQCIRLDLSIDSIGANQLGDS